MTSYLQRTQLHGWRRALAACFVLSLLTPFVAARAPETSAVGINVYYDDTIASAVDPCALADQSACPGGQPMNDELEFMAQVAAAYWSVIFHDMHNMEIRVAWVSGESPFARVVEVDDDGRPLVADVLVTAETNWFWDPTPFEDEEFDMTPKLYRDTHPAEQNEAFNGNVPEIFEVGFNGEENGADVGPDVLTILLHEIGHTIGLHDDIIENRPTVPCTEAIPGGDPYYHVDPALVGGANMSIKAFEQTEDLPITLGGHQQEEEDRQLAGLGDITVFYDCAHLAIGGIQECEGDADCEAHQGLMWIGPIPDARSRPSVVDILAIAEAAGWEEIHLPRKYSLGDGSWNDTDPWLGQQVPNAGNNVYIINQQTDATVNLYGDGDARDLYITDDNVLNVTFGSLDATRIELNGADTALNIDSGAELDSVYVNLYGDSTMHLADATADIFWTLYSNGLIRGGNAEIELNRLVNDGEIRSNGGPLTIVSTDDEPSLDLDGTMEWVTDRELRATTGDLTFEGQITDSIAIAVVVGNGYTMTFSDGWEQAYTNNPDTTLQMLGTLAPATISGETTLMGNVDPAGIGRFTDDVTFTGPAWSHLAIAIGGPTPGAEHDQLILDEHVSFASFLDLSLQGGFMPAPNDEFVIAEYASHSGEFDSVTGWDLGGFLRLELEYDTNELRAVARLAGDMNGDGQWTNKDKPLLAQSFGACVPDPLPCRGDMDQDGDIDKDDLQMLIRLLNANNGRTR